MNSPCPVRFRYKAFQRCHFLQRPPDSEILFTSTSRLSRQDNLGSQLLPHTNINPIFSRLHLRPHCSEVAGPARPPQLEAPLAYIHTTPEPDRSWAPEEATAIMAAPDRKPFDVQAAIQDTEDEANVKSAELFSLQTIPQTEEILRQKDQFAQELGLIHAQLRRLRALAGQAGEQHLFFFLSHPLQET